MHICLIDSLIVFHIQSPRVVLSVKYLGSPTLYMYYCFYRFETKNGTFLSFPGWQLSWARSLWGGWNIIVVVKGYCYTFYFYAASITLQRLAMIFHLYLIFFWHIWFGKGDTSYLNNTYLGSSCSICTLSWNKKLSSFTIGSTRFRWFIVQNSAIKHLYESAIWNY